MIPYGKHHIDGNDIKAVTKILKSNNLTQGPTILNFERAISKFVGRNTLLLFQVVPWSSHCINGCKKF